MIEERLDNVDYEQEGQEKEVAYSRGRGEEGRGDSIRSDSFRASGFLSYRISEIIILTGD